MPRRYFATPTEIIELVGNTMTGKYVMVKRDGKRYELPANIGWGIVNEPDTQGVSYEAAQQILAHQAKTLGKVGKVPYSEADGEGLSPPDDGDDKGPAGQQFQRLHFAWDESKHPRDDYGRFVSKGEIHAAAQLPAVAEELRDRVTDPEQRGNLEAAITEEKSRQKHGRPSTSERAHKLSQSLHFVLSDAARPVGGRFYALLDKFHRAWPYWLSDRFIPSGQTGPVTVGKDGTLLPGPALDQATDFYRNHGMSHEQWIYQMAMIHSLFAYTGPNGEVTGDPMGKMAKLTKEGRITEAKVHALQHGVIPDEMRKSGEKAFQDYYVNPNASTAHALALEMDRLADHCANKMSTQELGQRGRSSAFQDGGAAKDGAGRINVMGPARHQWEGQPETIEAARVGSIHPQTIKHFANMLRDPVGYGPVTFRGNRIESEAADALSEKHAGWDTGIRTPKKMPGRPAVREAHLSTEFNGIPREEHLAVHAKAVALANEILSTSHGTKPPELGVSGGYTDEVTAYQEALKGLPKASLEVDKDYNAIGYKKEDGTYAKPGERFILPDESIGFVPSSASADKPETVWIAHEKPTTAVVKRCRLLAQQVAQGLLDAKRAGFLVHGDWNRDSRVGYLDVGHERSTFRTPLTVDVRKEDWSGGNNTGGYYLEGRHLIKLNPTYVNVAAMREISAEGIAKRQIGKMSTTLGEQSNREMRGNPATDNVWGKSHNVGEGTAYIFVHELGHALHYAHDHKNTQAAVRGFHDDSQYYSQDESGYRYGMFHPDDRGILADVDAAGLSAYGRKNLLEMVAETFSKMVYGQPVDRRLLSLYKKYGGYLPAFLRSRRHERDRALRPQGAKPRRTPPAQPA